MGFYIYYRQNIYAVLNDVDKSATVLTAKTVPRDFQTSKN